MLGKNLSEALSNISDDKIEAAAHVVPKSRRHIWVRVAACAAVLALLIGAMFFWPGEIKEENGQIVAVPGVLKVYACDLEGADVTEDELKKYELSNDTPFLLALYNPLISASNFALPLTFHISGDYFGASELTFKITTEYGEFSENLHDPANYRNQITISNGGKLYFSGKSLLDAAKDIGEEQSFFADIVIYADGKIAGYGIISFCFKGATCYAHEFTTVCYPRLDGQLQEISEKYVQQQIAEYKQQKNVEVT